MTGIHFHTRSRKLTVKCYRNLNLLAHAQLEEVEIGSRCGGHGICGGDKIHINGKPGEISAVTDIERSHLTSDEINSGWRLGCQCWPNQDDLDFEVSVD